MHQTYKKSKFSIAKNATVACVALFSISANALIVLQQVSASAGTEFDNNPTLVENNAKSIWRYTLNPKYSVAAVDEKNRWFSNFGLNIVRTTNKNITDDREDPNLNLGWERELEKGRLSVVSSYNRTSSRFREFKNTGFVDNDGTSVSKSLGVSWSTAVTEKLDYSLGANLSKNINSGGSSLVKNSLRKSVNTSLTYALNDRLSPYVQYSYTKFEPNGIGSSKSNSQNYIGGIRYTISPQLSTSLGAGINHVSSSGSGKLLNAGLDYSGERQTASLSAGRNVTPSDIGQFQESDNFSASYNYLITEKSSVGLNFDFSKSRAADNTLGGNGGSIETTSSRLGGFYARELSQSWQMRVSLEEKQNKSNNQKANGEIIGIVFTYNTPEF